MDRGSLKRQQWHETWLKDADPQVNINANQERQLSRKFRCLSKEQKMDVLHLGFGYFRRLAYMDQDQIFEGMLKACDGDYEIFEEEISKLLKDENFSAISGGRVIHGKV